MDEAIKNNVIESLESIVASAQTLLAKVKGGEVRPNSQDEQYLLRTEEDLGDYIDDLIEKQN